MKARSTGCNDKSRDKKKWNIFTARDIPDGPNGA